MQFESERLGVKVKPGVSNPNDEVSKSKMHDKLKQFRVNKELRTQRIVFGVDLLIDATELRHHSSSEGLRLSRSLLLFLVG